jgi:serine/threonine protein kinase
MESSSLIGRTVSHYKVTGLIGQGGMGVVYRAQDLRLERDVALKVLRAGALGDETSRKKFRSEALSLSRLNHPNIATIHDFDSEDGIDFVVMECITGEPLSDRVRLTSLPEKQAIAVGIQIAAALEAAHEKGVIHRDLKPQNILLAAKGQVKVVDFGLAKVLQPGSDADVTLTMTDTDAQAGTLPYMAPEQLLGEATDERSDIWSAGAVLYEICTAQRPFPETRSTLLIAVILNKEPDPPRKVNPRVSAGLEQIILKALDKDPSRRYQSAREMRVDLERLAEGRQTGAATTRAPVSMWQTVSLCSAAAVLVLLGIIAAVGVDRHRRLVSAEEQALKQKDTIQVQARENSTPVGNVVVKKSSSPPTVQGGHTPTGGTEVKKSPVPQQPQQDRRPIGQVDVKRPVSPPQSQEDHPPTDHTVVLAPTSPEAKSTLNAGGGINWGNEELASVLKAANAGDAKAQVEIANRYFYALNGVGKDYSQAVAWYRKAADQGSAVGQSDLGSLYYYGHGLPQDYAQALFWFRKAADQGDASADANLGVMYANGQGVPQDYAQAVAWHRKAADQGSAVGQNDLGTLYQSGHGLPQDSAQALFWFRKAADQGDAFADINLGIMYENGQGVTKDLAQARMWYQKAADQGNEDAKRRLAALVVQH